MTDKATTLAEALAAAQGEIKPALKDSTNPHFKSRYADLASVWEACRGPLSRNGLSIVQLTEFEGEAMWLTTTMLHTSGEDLSARYPIRPIKNDPQGIGSALTYARRYSLAAMVGVVADEDDDGNRASGTKSAIVIDDPVRAAARAAELARMVEETGADIEKFCRYMNVGALSEIPASEHDRAVAALKAKGRK